MPAPPWKTRLSATCQLKPRRGPKLAEVGIERRAVAAVDVDFSAGVGDAVDAVCGLRIEVFEAIVALGAAAEDVPAQAGGDGEGLAGAPGVLDEAGVVGVGLGVKEVLGEVGIVVGFVAGLFVPCR